MSLHRLTVEVIYLEKGQYKSRKSFEYDVSQAWAVWEATVAKLEAERVSALVCIRDGHSEALMRAERVGPVEAIGGVIGKKRVW
jgi:hypothetical protein